MMTICAVSGSSGLHAAPAPRHEAATSTFVRGLEPVLALDALPIAFTLWLTLAPGEKTGGGTGSVAFAELGLFGLPMLMVLDVAVSALVLSLAAGPTRDGRDRLAAFGAGVVVNVLTAGAFAGALFLPTGEGVFKIVLVFVGIALHLIGTPLAEDSALWARMGS